MIFIKNGRMCLKMFGCVRQERGYWHRGRVLQDHAMLYLIDGGVTFEISGREYAARTYDVVFVPKGTFYRPLQSSGCQYYFFHFEAEEATFEQKEIPGALTPTENCEGVSYVFNGENNATLQLPLCFTPSNKNAVLDILARVEKLDLLDDGSGKSLLELYFREFLIRCTEPRLSERASTTLQRILRYIAENIQKPISLRSIAEAFYFSESYVARLFKRELGESAGNYIVRQKINFAYALLLNTDMRIAEVAERVGFSNAYYFSSVFSKYMGVSPNGVRKR